MGKAIKKIANIATFGISGAMEKSSDAAKQQAAATRKSAEDAAKNMNAQAEAAANQQQTAIAQQRAADAASQQLTAGLQSVGTPDVMIGQNTSSESAVTQRKKYGAGGSGAGIRI